MRNMILYVLLLCISSTAWTQEAITNFRGLEWGTNVARVEFEGYPTTDLLHKGGADNAQYYERSREDLTVGTAILDDIFYVFDKHDKFYKVILNGSASANEDMEYILLKRLGKPNKRFRKNTKFVRIWNVGDVDIILSEQRSKDFVLQIQNKQITNDYETINSNITDF